jgi:hypothetical protein
MGILEAVTCFQEKPGASVEEMCTMTVMNPPFAFREWVRDQKQTYSIFAAQAPIDQLVTEIKGIFQIQSHQANIPLTGNLSDLRGIPVVKFKDSPWIVVYWSIGRATLLRNDCNMLSEKLAGNVVNLTEKDTSGWVEWFFHQDGEEMEFADRMHDDTVYFESSLRDDLDFDELAEELDDPSEIRGEIDKAITELLIQKNIVIPGLDFEINQSIIERIDLLQISEHPLGMKEFQDWINQGHPEYAVFAVRAPIEAVGQMLTKEGYASDRRPQVQSTDSLMEIIPDDNYKWKPVIQPAANSWTVLYWAVSYWTDLESICQKIASRLETRVISLREEDTSCSVCYTIYERDQLVELVSWCPGEDLYFQSEIRNEPELDDFSSSEGNVINRFINETFIAEGVYIPSLDLKVSDPFLDRVDLLLAQ